MLKTEVIKTKLTLKYENDGGFFTFSNISTNASNAGIMMTAEAISLLQEKVPEKLYKTVETLIESN